MKDDEKELLKALQIRAKQGVRLMSIRETISDLKIKEKRGIHILKKWTGRGWYNYELFIMTGWLTKEGIAVNNG